jgi:hypothetical protein
VLAVGAADKRLLEVEVLVGLEAAKVRILAVTGVLADQLLALAVKERVAAVVVVLAVTQVLGVPAVPVLRQLTALMVLRELVVVLAGAVTAQIARLATSITEMVGRAVE